MPGRPSSRSERVVEKTLRKKAENKDLSKRLAEEIDEEELPEIPSRIRAHIGAVA